MIHLLVLDKRKSIILTCWSIHGAIGESNHLWESSKDTPGVLHNHCGVLEDTLNVYNNNNKTFSHRFKLLFVRQTFKEPLCINTILGIILQNVTGFCNHFFGSVVEPWKGNVWCFCLINNFGYPCHGSAKGACSVDVDWCFTSHLKIFFSSNTI